jgi:signal transduction histidine kinase
VLVADGETLYSWVSIQPEELLSLSSEWSQELCETAVDGRHILVSGEMSVMMGVCYGVYVVKDISAVYDGIADMAWEFAAICAAGILAGAMIIILLTRNVAKPLMQLGVAARQIAQGEYEKRAVIRSSDEVGELARSFNDMAGAVESQVAKLKDTVERQKLFIGGLTHEYKTPLASILIHSETLLAADLSGDKARDSLAHIYSQCRAMERLTKKMLSLVALGQSIQMRETSVCGLFEDVAATLAETLAERGTPLVVERAEGSVACDYDLMKQLLVNLVDNASKASKPGQSITLKACDSAIEVVDSGAGIPKEILPFVTEPFYMADASRAKRKGGGGLGLGLALAKRIADAHGAELAIESEPGVGTRVSVMVAIRFS